MYVRMYLCMHVCTYVHICMFGILVCVLRICGRLGARARYGPGLVQGHEPDARVRYGTGKVR